MTEDAADSPPPDEGQGSTDASLEARIARLEAEVAALKQQSSVRPNLQGARGSRRAPPHAQAAPQPTEAAKPPKEPVDWGARAEGMLGKVGVAFLVLALGFLFKYSFDQGWITPLFRVLLGGLGGIAMLLIGLRLESVRRTYAAILLGGGIAVLYISTYAAYELYGFVPWIVAFSIMATITLVALVLAERQDHPSLASLGASGGLSTPFLLSSGSDSVPGLVAYVSLILLGAGAVQFRRGWRSLLGVLAFGGITVMVLAADQASGSARWSIALGVGVLWVVIAVAPTLRRWLHDGAPESWPVPGIGKQKGERIAAFDGLLRVVLAVVTSIAAVFILRDTWRWDWDTAGLVLLLGAAPLFGALALTVARSPKAQASAVESAAILAAIGMWIGVDHGWVPVLQAALAAGLIWLSLQRGMKGAALIGHLLFGGLAFWFMSVALEPRGLGRSDWGWLAMVSQLGAIVLAFLTGSRMTANLRVVYLALVHVSMLCWLYSVFAPLENGQGVVTLAWGVYGVGLLVTSFVLGQRGLQLAGLATLGLVAAKLVLVDMAQLDVIWRILMFLGFGVVFLVLSYFINRRPSQTP